MHSCPNISISLIIDRKGEGKAHACEMACKRQFRNSNSLEFRGCGPKCHASLALGIALQDDVSFVPLLDPFGDVAGLFAGWESFPVDIRIRPSDVIMLLWFHGCVRKIPIHVSIRPRRPETYCSKILIGIARHCKLSVW